MDWIFDVIYKNRILLKGILEQLSLKELNTIPSGFKNNVIWNIAHTIATQQILVYKLSGLPTLVSDEFIEQFRKGTKPEREVTQEEVDNIKDLLFATLEQTKMDYANQIFNSYNEYTTSTNSTLTCVEDAIGFNCFHEGIHLGYILALKKSI
ncbi:DinB family protein [Mangrovimonas sp. YM274]|uniref:DinB family protein n=1 Tax=Mangrovimonas sp. YM274 TaxID=3070660 RepID=UPI0027DD6D69|nr:DinB family protein [Mangrovimonas sp. YM274]WMI69222.1 DinB family protein [Mangrovimonas sp. YM274]